MQADKDILRIKRAKKDITKTKLAELSGIDRKQISLYEKDINKCSIGKLIKISEVLEFDPIEIFLP